ncbi:hypothetical protein JHN63_20985 [Streptomyces sp. MBT65]|uniref:hypothetical protein n=1 Tax=Streptomyces sp. MBT65 TaxID=1488395 RepID=UPI00190B107F|nr:hypothetical protein [Streptomyces sp. MBT65]MBK3576248.1 hypothetical protein [Streptomyces sp. MBT65]
MAEPRVVGCDQAPPVGQAIEEGFVHPRAFLNRPAQEAEAYRADLPGAGVCLLDGGLFVLDTCADEAARRIRAFLT